MYVRTVVKGSISRAASEGTYANTHKIVPQCAYKVWQGIQEPVKLKTTNE